MKAPSYSEFGPVYVVKSYETTPETCDFTVTRWRVEDLDGAELADCDSEQDAKAVCRSVNSHHALVAALDPDTLEAIADEIGHEHKHSARAHSLRILAKKQRLALAAAKE